VVNVPEITVPGTSLFLGIDFGTSGARACAIDQAKSIVWQHRVDYPFPEKQDPIEWRSALYTLLKALPKDIACKLQGLAMDGTSGTVLLCNAELEPCSPPLLYNDQRAREQAEHLKKVAPEIHVVSTATSGLAKFIWLSQQTGIEHAAYFMHQADWLTALLSGQPGISDHHNALKSGFDVEKLCWPEWVKQLPHSQLLPTVVNPGAIIGNIREDIATHFGINPNCEIHAGTTDSNAAFIAAEVYETGIGVTSLGTTLVIKQLSSQRIEAPEYGVYSHRYGDLWLVGGASNAGAGVLRRFFDDKQLAKLSSQIDPGNNAQLDYYPLIKPGERFPINDVHLAPRLEPRPESDVEFLHGMLQGIAKIEAAGYSRLTELGASPIERVITNGGGAKNITWEKIREKSLGVPVEAAKHGEASVGCALLARSGSIIRPALE